MALENVVCQHFEQPVALGTGLLLLGFVIEGSPLGNAEFGMIDAICHSCIIAVVLAVLADDARAPLRRRTVLLAPLGNLAMLAGFLLAYYGFDAALFGTTTGEPSALLRHRA